MLSAASQLKNIQLNEKMQRAYHSWEAGREMLSSNTALHRRSQ